MPLSRCLEEVSYREYLLWMAWLDKQWNQPDRSDHYLMQVSRDIARVLSKHPGRIQTKDFKIEFERDGKPLAGEVKPEISLEEAAARSKAVWRFRLKAIREKARKKQADEEYPDTNQPLGGDN